MNVLLTLLHVLIILAIVWRCVRDGQRMAGLGRHGYISFVLKALAGYALGFYYWEIIGMGDTLAFHEEALLLKDWAGKDPAAYLRYLAGADSIPFDSVFEDSPRTQWFSKWASIIYVTGPGYYWLASLYFSLLAWLGLYSFSVVLIRWRREWRNPVLFSLLYLPSVLFWSSGFTKESLSVGVMALIAAWLMRWRWIRTVQSRVLTALVLACLFMIIWQIKYYYFVVLLFSIITGWFLTSKWIRWHLALRVLVAVVAIVLAWWVLSGLRPNLLPDYLPELIWDQYQAFLSKSDPGKFISFSTLCPKWDCVLLTMPFAVLAGFYLPLPYDAWGIFPLLAGLENLGLITLTLFWLLSLKRNLFEQRISGFFITGWMFCILLSGFLAMSSPNLGSLVRYRIGFLPVFVLLITVNNGYFCRWMAKLANRLNKLKNS